MVFTEDFNQPNKISSNTDTHISPAVFRIWFCTGLINPRGLTTPTSEDDVGHVVSALLATVVLVLVVEELLVPGLLQVQGALAIGRGVVPVGDITAQAAVVQRWTVALVISHELKQRTDKYGRQLGPQRTVVMSQ